MQYELFGMDTSSLNDCGIKFRDASKRVPNSKKANKIRSYDVNVKVTLDINGKVGINLRKIEVDKLNAFYSTDRFYVEYGPANTAICIRPSYDNDSDRKSYKISERGQLRVHRNRDRVAKALGLSRDCPSRVIVPKYYPDGVLLLLDNEIGACNVHA